MNILCEQCGSLMKVIKKGKALHKRYRIRRCQCTVCDAIRTIYGDGEGDDIRFPAASIESQKKYFKQQENNEDAHLF